jgi:hypothetical protein
MAAHTLELSFETFSITSTFSVNHNFQLMHVPFNDKDKNLTFLPYVDLHFAQQL